MCIQNPGDETLDIPCPGKIRFPTELSSFLTLRSSDNVLFSKPFCPVSSCAHLPRFNTKPAESEGPSHHQNQEQTGMGNHDCFAIIAWS